MGRKRQQPQPSNGLRRGCPEEKVQKSPKGGGGGAEEGERDVSGGWLRGTLWLPWLFRLGVGASNLTLAIDSFANSRVGTLTTTQ